jgi:hypothetical protein
MSILTYLFDPGVEHLLGKPNLDHLVHPRRHDDSYPRLILRGILNSTRLDSVDGLGYQGAHLDDGSRAAVWIRLRRCPFSGVETSSASPVRCHW